MAKAKSIRSTSRSRNRSLIISAAVLAASIFGVWLFAQAANPKQQVLIAKAGLSAGSQVTAESVSLLDVNLSGAEQKYLRAIPSSQSIFLIASVRAGELIPLAQLVNSAEDTRVPVQVSPAMGIAKAIKVGSAIDLWASKQQSAQVFAEPRILTLGAEVSEIIEPTGMFANSGRSLELMVHPDDVPAIIAASAAGDKFAAILKPTLLDQ
jgi:hypothetical protein